MLGKPGMDDEQHKRITPLMEHFYTD